jgi:hypothetical protein
MKEIIYRGVLTGTEGKSFLLGADGTRYLEDEIIWSGYLLHWRGLPVCARRLPQRDYETERPIVIMWPDEPLPEGTFVDLCFTERLRKYPISFLGHLAVNINGEIFNFSHLLNENEVLRHEEYFFRPARGEFAPHPASGRDNTADPQRPYYDKFGRLFMRNIHVLRITGLDTQKFSQFSYDELNVIRNTPPDPGRPGHYADFNLFTRSCSTIIRDGFRNLGFKKIRGVFPRELFVNVAYYFLHQLDCPLIKASRFTLHQLRVPEAAASAMPPLLNPLNRYKYCRLSTS